MDKGGFEMQDETFLLPGFYIPREKLKVIEDFLSSGFHVMLAGNPGCGKTEFGQVWAASRGTPVHKVNCGAIRSPRDWFGRHEFREGIGTVFVPTKFLDMLERPGLIILDEINRTTPDNHNPIMNILDGNREVYVEELQRYVRVHEGTIFLATLNAGRQHTGTFHLDHALEDRFQEIRLELPPKEVIAQLLLAKYSIPSEHAETIARLTVKLNDMYDEEMFSKAMGMRPAFAAAALLQKGNSLDVALRYAFVNRYSREGGPESEQALAMQTIQGLVR
jgi:nitric oxide reductase NorQ protein